MDIKKSKDGGFIYVVLEYCNQGTLQNWLDKQGQISP